MISSHFPQGVLYKLLHDLGQLKGLHFGAYSTDQMQGIKANAFASSCKCVCLLVWTMYKTCICLSVQVSLPSCANVCKLHEPYTLHLIWSVLYMYIPVFLKKTRKIKIKKATFVSGVFEAQPWCWPGSWIPDKPFWDGDPPQFSGPPATGSCRWVWWEWVWQGRGQRSQRSPSQGRAPSHCWNRYMYIH